MERNELFIIGSGFSKDVADFPILTNFTSKIMDYIHDDVAKNIVSSLPDNLKINTETLFSYLYSKIPWVSDAYNDIHRGVFKILSRALSDLFFDLETQMLIEQSEAFDQVIRYWHRKHSTLLTFNYDTLIERRLEDFFKVYYESIPMEKPFLKSKNYSDFKNVGLISRRFKNCDKWIIYDSEKHNIEVNIDIDEKTIIHSKYKQYSSDIIESIYYDKTSSFPINDKQLVTEIRKVLTGNLSGCTGALNHRVASPTTYQGGLSNFDSRKGAAMYGSEDVPSLKLFKLHGSVNWYYSGAKDTFSETIYYQYPKINNPQKSEESNLFPVIIPPTLQKDGFYNNASLAAQWAPLTKSIAENYDLILYLIGYSIPQTDFIINAYFMKLQNGGKIKVYIVNKFQVDESGFLDEESRFALIRYIQIFTGCNSVKENDFKKLLDEEKIIFLDKNGQEKIIDISLSIILGKNGREEKNISSTLNLANHFNKP